MSWKVHFNGEDYGPIPDEEYEKLLKLLVDASEGVDGVHHVGYQLKSVDTVSGKRVGFFWTPGAPISFTHVG